MEIVEVYGQTLEAIIDLGSNRSWVHTRHLTFLADTGVAVERHETTYVDDAAFLFKVHLEVKVRRRYIYGDFVVSSHIVSDMIIGNDILSATLALVN